MVCSASLTVVQQRNEIEEVAEGKRAIARLFSSDQERFLGDFYQGKFDFAELRVLGPIRVLRWELKHKGFPYELTIEEWRLPNGDDLVEASIKVSPDEAPGAHKEFDQHLKQFGLDPKGAQEAKARTALEYFAKAYREAK